MEGAYRTTDAEIDLRPGGRYRFTGTSERTGTFEVEGEYREVDSPRRLAYTWSPARDDPVIGWPPVPEAPELRTEARG